MLLNLEIMRLFCRGGFSHERDDGGEDEEMLGDL